MNADSVRSLFYKLLKFKERNNLLGLIESRVSNKPISRRYSSGLINTYLSAGANVSFSPTDIDRQMINE